MARERLIKWNNELLTFNNKYIRPKDVTTDYVPPSYPKDGLIERWGMQTQSDTIFGRNWTTIVAGATFGESGPSAELYSVYTNTNQLERTTLLDGSDTSIANAIEGGPYTWSFWIKTDSSVSSQWIFHRGYPQTNGKAHLQNQLNIGSEAKIGLGMSQPNVAGYIITNGNANVRDGNWHHIVGTFNGTTFYQYVDTNEDGSLNGTPSAYDNKYLQIGEPGINYSYPLWTGPMYLYNRIITTQEITQLYNSGRGV